MFDLNKLLWSRRAFLATGVAGVSGLALRASGRGVPDAAVCKLDPELTQGPYYLKREMVRRNITEGRPGIPLQLRLAIVNAKTCAPIENAALEIWHCDAGGVYSGFTKMSPDGGPGMPPPPGRGRANGMRPPPPPDMGPPQDGEEGPPPGFGRQQDPDDTTFCRGVQLTRAGGLVDVDTVYPGWYMGRDIHIHLKVHIGGNVEAEKYKGGHVSHTGQLFFPEDLSDRIAKLEPYAKHHTPRTRLDDDMVFADAHGAASMLELQPLDKGSLANGLIGRVTLHVDPDATSLERHPGGPGGRPTGPPPTRS